MRRTLTLLLFTLPAFLWAQEETKVETDTSFIKTKYFDYLNSIRVFNNLKKENKTYYEEYYYNTKRLKEKGIFVDGDCAGIWKEYAANGKLKSQINYDKCVIMFYDKKSYPFYKFQNRIKLLADSIIKSIYSPEFFNKYVLWNIGGSAIYNDTESGDWTDALGMKPSKFLLRYNLNVNGHVYKEMIEFEIDSTGKVLPEEMEEMRGFEKLPPSISKTFSLTSNKAIELAKQQGLIETPLAKAQAFLYWENFKSKSIYTGKFRFYVIIKTNSIKDIRPKGRSTITDKFDVYVFNPWTGGFVEKKKMKAYHSWERRSGNSTGLLPDK